MLAHPMGPSAYTNGRASATQNGEILHQPFSTTQYLNYLCYRLSLFRNLPIPNMSFTNFPRLSQELQDLIWAEAAAIQYQHIADTQTEVCTDPHAERQRQAIVGYDDLPDSIERQPLRLYVYASHDTDELRLVANEAQTLANCLPMATVCVDARKYAVELCLSRIKLMNLLHVVEDPIPDGTQILDPVFPQLTTVMVMTARSHPEDAPEGFDSVEHCVDVISRVFGSNVQKIIWNNWSQSGNSLSDIYWPHTSLIDGLEIM
jgi:hypothetical protein